MLTSVSLHSLSQKTKSKKKKKKHEPKEKKTSTTENDHTVPSCPRQTNPGSPFPQN